MLNILSKIHRVEKLNNLKYGDNFEIILSPSSEKIQADKMTVGKFYKIKVKKYMTQPATVTFDFQNKWNGGIPMPSTELVGEAISETRGMIQMKSKEWQGWVIKSAILNWEEVDEY